MENDNLLARQREALIAFRRAEEERQRKEKELEQHFESIQQETRRQKQTAQAQQQRGQTWLRQINLAHLVHTRTKFVPTGTPQHPSKALSQAVAQVQQAATNVEKSVQDLQSLRKAKDAANAASRYAQQAQRSAAEAKQSLQAINDCQARTQPTKRWKTADYHRQQIDNFLKKVPLLDKQAEKHAHEASQAAQRAQSALTSADSGAAAARIAKQAESNAKSAAQQAASAAQKAQGVVQEALEAVDNALKAAEVEAKEWRKTIIAIVLLALVAAAFYFLFYVPSTEGLSEGGIVFQTIVIQTHTYAALIPNP